MASMDIETAGVTGTARGSSATGLRLTERRGGYVYAEDGEIDPARAMGRLLGVSLVVAGLGLLALPVGGVGLVAKLVIAVALVITGGIFAAGAGDGPRMELEVDLDKRLLRRRRLTGRGPGQLVAQWSFSAITGLEVEGETGRAALVLNAEGRAGAVLRGAPEAVREAARRIGADLVRARKAG